MTPSTIPREEIARCLVSEGFSVAELSLALEVSGQTAREYLRLYGTRSQNLDGPMRVGLSATDLYSPMQLFSLEKGRRFKAGFKPYFRRGFFLTNRFGAKQWMPAMVIGPRK